MPAVTDKTNETTISGLPFRYRRWRPGDRRLDPEIAIDTETALIIEHEIPALALATASDGRQNVLIHPDDLSGFVRAHASAEFVCHNAAFDFWVIFQHLQQKDERDALAVWTNVVRNRRLHDTMLFDVLIRLASGERTGGDDDAIPPRNLAAVSMDYTGLEISKTDEYRLRYAELIDRGWERVESGFFEYAIKDAIATILVYFDQRPRAEEIMAAGGFDPSAREKFQIYPDAPARFGLLSEAIQVEGAIALAAVSRNGLYTDPVPLQRYLEQDKTAFTAVIEELRAQYPGVVLLDSAGKLKLTEKGVPRKSFKKLDEYLQQALAQVSRTTDTPVLPPRAKKGGLSHSLDAWEPLIATQPVFQAWKTFETTAKRLQFFQALNKPVIHPRYNILKRTGRTSCFNPNLQNVPRDGAFRHIIVPSPGHLLLAVDYSFIELVTLAAVCRAKYGYSRLGDIICDGTDPHAYTAAMLLNVPPDEFLGWESTDKKRYKLHRQQAKSVNFGVPGGMGAAALVEYAKATYKVELTLEQAQAFHTKLTTVVYPELGEYLADDSLTQLAQELRVAEVVCRDALTGNSTNPSMAIGAVRKIVAGNAVKQDGTPYNVDYVARTWQGLREINANPDLTEVLRSEIGSPRLVAQLFRSRAVSLTGRVRGNVSYTQARNTPFQSLASDGAKRALGRLVLAGYRVVGFIHDEVLVELPDQGGFVRKSAVDAVVSIMQESMREMTNNVPVSCEYAVSTCWSKQTELDERNDDDTVWAWTPASE